MTLDQTTRINSADNSNRPLMVLGDSLDIAFVNNMPDGAFCQTERQFAAVLKASRYPVRIHRYVLPSIRRRGPVGDYVRSHYQLVDELWETRPDAVIVTGTEPRFERLSDEPFWDDLCSVLAWGSSHTCSLLLSCLSAHAGLLFFSGVCREALPSKHTGVFDQEMMVPHAITAGLSVGVRIPHSRRNDVPCESLQMVGFDVIVGSKQGWSIAAHESGGCLVVLLQGHPEYDAHALLLEYRRDVRRYLDGEATTYPVLPQGYFDGEAVLLLERYRERCMSEKVGTIGRHDFPFGDVTWRVTSPWRRDAYSIYSNWTDDVACRARRRFGKAATHA